MEIGEWKMKKIKKKLAVLSSVLLLTSQYGLGVVQVVHAETREEPSTEVVDGTTEGSVQGIGTKVLTSALKFVGEASLQYALLELEEHSESPMISSMATSVLRSRFPADMIFRELDQMKAQLDAISQQITDLTNTVNQRFAELNNRVTMEQINTKRKVFHDISDRYLVLSESYDAAIEAYGVYGDNPSGANYQKFYNAYVGLSKLMGEGDQAEQLDINFQRDLAQLLSLLSPTRKDGTPQQTGNYLYSLQEYANNTLVFRHQAYDLLTTSFEEITGYALNYLMTYRTYTTTRIEEKKNQIYAATTQKQQEALTAEITTLQKNYQAAAEQLLTAINDSAEYYLVPIMDAYLSEKDRLLTSEMDYKEKSELTMETGSLNYKYTIRAKDTKKLETFYRVKPIGVNRDANNPLGSQTNTYYILNHGSKSGEGNGPNINRHLIKNLWEDDKWGTNNFFFVNQDFYNLKKMKNAPGGILLQNPQGYSEFLKMPSYAIANNNFADHLTQMGELPKDQIMGDNNQWLLNSKTDPFFNNMFEIIDGKIGLLSASKIDANKKYSDEDVRVNINDLKDKSYANKEKASEPYLVILQGQKEEAFQLVNDGPNANMLSYEVAAEDQTDTGTVVAGAKISLKVKLPAAPAGFKNEVTQVALHYASGEEHDVIYSNQTKTADGETLLTNEIFEVPTEFITTMPYGDARFSVEYETIPESYGLNLVSADEKGTLLPGYATFSAASYQQDKAKFEETVEVNVSPLEGYVATGVEVTAEDGSVVATTRLDAAESGLPSFGGGVFRFQMPAGKVNVKPIYEKGVVVDLKTDPSELIDENVLSFVDHNLWDTNILDDEFNEAGNKIEDTYTRGTFAKEADLNFTAKNTEKYALKSILGDIPGSADDVDIPLEESGKYQHTLPKGVTGSYSITATYLDFNNKDNQVKLVTSEGGTANFAGVSNTIKEMPFTEGETVNINIAPDAAWAFDEKQLKITLNGQETKDYQLKQFVDQDETPKAQVSFKKVSGAVQVNIGFTQENLVYLEAEGGSLRFKESNTNRETYAAGEKIQVKIDPFDKFDKESLQIVAEGQEVVAKEQVAYDGDVFSFTKPDTSAVITVKGSFETENTITKVVEEIGKGQNDFQVLNKAGAEITKAYSHDEVSVSMTPESRDKLVQLLVVGESSGTKTALDLTKELTFTMPNEAIRIEASFDNEQGRDDNHPDQNKDGHYVLKTYEQFVQAGKLMNLPLKDNSYQNATYVLDRIVDFKDQAWQPWGTAEQPFTATLDGKGFGIINLNIQGSALIDTIGKDGVLKNLGILSVKVKEVTGTNLPSYGGVLAGQNYGTIDNVYLGLAPEITHVRVNDQVSYPRAELNQAVMQNGFNFGSVVGKNYGKVMNATNYLSLKARSTADTTKRIGGMVGLAAANSSVVNTTNLGKVDVSEAGGSLGDSGGIIANGGTSATVKNNYAHFDIVGSLSRVAPIIGGSMGLSTAPLDNYYREVDYEYGGTPGTKLTSEKMKANSFKDMLNDGVAANGELKKWNRKENRNQGLPFMEGGHIFVNQLSQQTLSAGIFTVTSHLPYDTTLRLANLSDKQDTEFFKHAVKSGKIEELVDLSLQHPDVAVKAFKDAEIKIDVSKFEKANEKRGFKLLHQTGDKVEEVALTREGNYLVGRVDSLSPFALVSAADEKEIEIDETPASPEGDNTSNKGKLPMTGEQVSLGLTVLGAILCGSGLLYYKKRRETEKD